MGHSTASGRTGGGAGANSSDLERRARSASVADVISTFESNVTGNIDAQIIANSAERELERRLSESGYAGRQDAPSLRDPENATAQEREDWIRSASNRQLMSAFSSSASRLRRAGIPSSLDGSQYRLARAEIIRRINDTGRAASVERATRIMQANDRIRGTSRSAEEINRRANRAADIEEANRRRRRG